jgi:RNA-directed DNA polymerase
MPRRPTCRAAKRAICCRGHAQEALAVMRTILTKLKLTVNETKTRVCRLPDG